MKGQRKYILKLAALSDVVIALGMFAAILVFNVNIPILVPAFLGLAGVMLGVLSLVMK
jgi:hypothetical protein